MSTPKRIHIKVEYIAHTSLEINLPEGVGLEDSEEIDGIVTKHLNDHPIRGGNGGSAGSN